MADKGIGGESEGAPTGKTKVSGYGYVLTAAGVAIGAEQHLGPEGNTRATAAERSGTESSRTEPR
jgi:hypothetical protein